MLATEHLQHRPAALIFIGVGLLIFVVVITGPTKTEHVSERGEVFSPTEKTLRLNTRDAAAILRAITEPELINPQDALQKVDDGVIELLGADGKHWGNGLLVTENGYFLTVFHCVSGSFQIRLRDKRIFPVKRGQCIGNKFLDFALAKANMPGPPVARRYKFREPGPQRAKKIIAMKALTRWDGDTRRLSAWGNRDFRNSTFYNNSRFAIRHVAPCLLRTIPGASGGTVVDCRGGIVGMVDGVNRFESAAMLIGFYNSFRFLGDEIRAEMQEARGR